jgi:hypothetical protein
MGRFRVVMTAAVCAALAATALAAGSGSAAPMKGRFDGNASSCGRGTKPAIVAGQFKCLRVGQRCKARYQASYKRYGFVCVAGYLHKRASAKPTPPPTPEPPPAPAPTPAAVDGHYKGVTSQNETFEFDITSGGLSFRGLKTGQINEGCTPQLHLYGGYLNWPNYVVPVSFAGDFTIDTDLTGWYVGNWPATEHVTIRGHMSGQAGSGSLEMKTGFNGNGTVYSCGSGLQTWSVTRTG